MFRMMMFALLVSLTGCAKFKAGDCIQNPQDGFVWRITKVGTSKYILQGWFDGKWGEPVEGSFSLFDSRYINISCPFSDKSLRDEDNSTF